MLRPRPIVSVFAAFAALVLHAVPALAQAPAPAGAPVTPTEDDIVRFTMPAVTVTARKEADDRQKVPVSVTAVTRETLDAAGVRIVSEAAIFAPNVVLTEATARKLSNARFRGVGSSPGNPGITTYIDGVPQLNANSSSLELLDVDQVEFVRGPQSALFGRNALGGVITVASSRPSLDGWTGSATLPIANHGGWALRAGASGPVADRLAIGLSIAQTRRDGFTVNDRTGQPIDDRSAFSAKGQLLWTPSAAWETRVLVTAERARDGDYGFHDVGELRARPFRAARDLEGRTERDVAGTTLAIRRSGGPVVVTSTTGLVRWSARDITDLDYSPQPLLQRDNAEDDLQLTQELRVASSPQAPVRLGDAVSLRWQGGVFAFRQAYDQDALNTYAPFVAAPFELRERAPRAELDDRGVGVFGQATVTVRDRVDVTAGLRLDHESKDAAIDTAFEPAIAPPSRVEADASFTNVSPQVAIAWRIRPDRTVYATLGRGFKAGGFNAASPAGREVYDEERAWHFEGGGKTSWAGGRVVANAAVFHIEWNELQLNVPNPASPAQFFIANVGGARSRGAEVELSARAARGLDLFVAAGYTHARFATGSASGAASLVGNRVPFTPGHTIGAGAQYVRRALGGNALGRIDVVRSGAFHYDEANTLGQDAYTLVHLRGAWSTPRWLAEVFVRNAFDARYIPFAIPYPGLAPSGFVGEMGAPRTFGASFGVRF